MSERKRLRMKDTKIETNSTKTANERWLKSWIQLNNRVSSFFASCVAELPSVPIFKLAAY